MISTQTSPSNKERLHPDHYVDIQLPGSSGALERVPVPLIVEVKIRGLTPVFVQHI